MTVYKHNYMYVSTPSLSSFDGSGLFSQWSRSGNIVTTSHSLNFSKFNLATELEYDGFGSSTGSSTTYFDDSNFYRADFYVGALRNTGHIWKYDLTGSYISYSPIDEYCRTNVITCSDNNYIYVTSSVPDLGGGIPGKIFKISKSSLSVVSAKDVLYDVQPTEHSSQRLFLLCENSNYAFAKSYPNFGPTSMYLKRFDKSSMAILANAYRYNGYYVSLDYAEILDTKLYMYGTTAASGTPRILIIVNISDLSIDTAYRLYSGGGGTISIIDGVLYMARMENYVLYLYKMDLNNPTSIQRMYLNGFSVEDSSAKTFEYGGNILVCSQGVGVYKIVDGFFTSSYSIPTGFNQGASSYNVTDITSLTSTVSYVPSISSRIVNPDTTVPSYKSFVDVTFTTDEYDIVAEFENAKSEFIQII